MADQTYDPRLETLLREVLATEAASLPLTLGPDRVLERAATVRSRSRLRPFVVGQPTTRVRRVSMSIGAVAVLAVAVVALRLSPAPDRVDPAVALPSATESPDLTPTPLESPVPRTSASPSSEMWPQTSLDEVRQAQDLADARDPRYMWQVDPALGDVGHMGQHHPGDAKIFPRFLEEVLGWEEFLDGHHVPRQDMAGLDDGEFVYIRCAPGGTNPLYSTDPDDPGCAPTIDELRYEAVKIRVTQPDQKGLFGIWVVTGWEMIGPAEQAAPPSDAEITASLGAFLQARVDGEGAEAFGDDFADGLNANEGVPLLYATTTGARYERTEFELVDGPVWPSGHMQFEVRLFADGGKTLVEQRFWMERDESGRVRLDYARDSGTTENGKAVPVEYSLLDGEVTYRAAAPLAPSTDEYRDVAIEGLVPDDFALLLMLADPTPFAPGSCVEAPAPADAEALARIIGSDAKWEATAPEDVTIGGIPALRMDVVLAPGATICSWSEGDISESGPLLKYARFEMKDRARLYLVDLPEGSQARVLAIVTITDEDSFETVREAAAPIIDSIKFHAP